MITIIKQDKCKKDQVDETDERDETNKIPLKKLKMNKKSLEIHFRDETARKMINSRF